MNEVVLVLLAAAIALGVLGIHWKSGIRSVARVILGILFTLSLLTTVALLVASVALSSRGGGVLFLFALPAAIVTWISGSLLFASLKGERYFDLSVEAKISHNLTSLERSLADLRASIAAKTAQRERFWIGARRRAQLDREIARERDLLENLPRLRPGLESPEAYGRDEP